MTDTRTYLCFNVTDPLDICQRIFKARYPDTNLEVIHDDKHFHWLGPIPEAKTQTIRVQTAHQPHGSEPADASGGTAGDHHGGN